MIPILLPADWVGPVGAAPEGPIGFLSEATSAKITEVLNGEFQLEITYPSSGHLANDLEPGQQIMAAYADVTELFRITRMTKNMGNFQIYAPQISIDLNKCTVFPFTATDANAAVTALNGPNDPLDPGQAMWDHGFHLSLSNFDETTYDIDFIQEKPASIRSVMGGSDSSMTGVYGGEWQYAGRECMLSSQRGWDWGVEIRYGGNLVNFQQEQNIAEMYTGIAPYATYNNSTRILSEGYIMASGAFTQKNILAVDLSSEFSGYLPTEAQLRQKAVEYIRTHAIGVPEVSLTVNFADIQISRVGVGDTVTVIFPRLNVYAKARTCRVVYDSLREKLVSADIGTKKQGLYDTILNLGKPSQFGVIPSGWIEAETQPTKYFSAYAAPTAGTYFGRSGNRLYNSSGDYYAYWKTAYSTTYSGWRLFDNSTGTGYAASSSDTSPFVGIRLSKRLRYVTISIANRTGSESTNVNGPKAGIIYGANAESDTLVEVARFSGWDGKTAGKVNSITLMNDTPYKAYIIDVTDWENRTRTNNHYMAIGEVYLNGQEEA